MLRRGGVVRVLKMFVELVVVGGLFGWVVGCSEFSRSYSRTGYI